MVEAGPAELEAPGVSAANTTMTDVTQAHPGCAAGAAAAATAAAGVLPAEQCPQPPPSYAAVAAPHRA